jgi:hypothetical protein
MEASCTFNLSCTNGRIIYGSHIEDLDEFAFDCERKTERDVLRGYKII